MTLYDLTRKYGAGQGEAMMWKAVAVISDAVDSYMPEEEKDALVRKVYGEMSGGHYNEEFAREDVKRMYYTDRNGEKHYGPYWTEDALTSIYRQHKNEIPGYNCWDFMVTMTMAKSDMYPIITAWFPELTDDGVNEKLVQYSINWLKDDDNPFGNEKIWGYLNAR